MIKIFTAWTHKYVCTLLGNLFLEIIFSSQQFHLKRSKTKKLLRPRLCNLPEVLNTGRAGLCTQDNQTHAEMSRKLLSVWIFFSPPPKEEIVTRFYLECPDKAALSGTSRTLIPLHLPAQDSISWNTNLILHWEIFYFCFFFPPNKTNLQTASLAF